MGTLCTEKPAADNLSNGMTKYDYLLSAVKQMMSKVHTFLSHLCTWIKNMEKSDTEGWMATSGVSADSKNKAM
jgi:hypothetical protein